MATQAELETALRKADAAGNSEDARRFAAALRQMRTAAPAAAQPAPNAAIAPGPDPISGMSGGEKFLSGMGKAFSDTATGLKMAGTDAARYFVEGGLGMPAPGLRQSVATQQAAIDETRRLDTPLMDTGAGVTGNVAGYVAQLPVGGLLGKGAAIPATIAGNAVQGGVMAGIQPVATGETRLGNTSLGAAFGAGGAVLAKPITRIAKGLSDKITPAMKEMYDEVVSRGIQPNITGLLESGGLLSTMEFVRGLPFAGGANSIKRELGQFTQAVSRTFGMDAKELSKEVMNQAEKQIGGNYDAILGNRTITPDTQFIQAVQKLVDSAPRELDQQQREMLQNNIGYIMQQADASGSYPATLYQEMRRRLADTARRAGDKGVKDYIQTLRRAFDDAAVRSIAQSDPAAANALMDTNRAYANMMKAREALDQPGGRPGVLTPQRMASATKPSTSATAGPRSTTSMRSLSDAAEKAGVGGAKQPSRGMNALTGLGGTAAIGGAGLAGLGGPAAAAGLGVVGVGRFINSPGGSRYLAEGLGQGANTFAEILARLTRGTASASGSTGKKDKK